MSFVFFFDIFITYTNWNNYLQKFMYIVRRMHKNDDGDGMRMRSYAVKSVLLCYVLLCHVLLCYVMSCYVPWCCVVCVYMDCDRRWEGRHVWVEASTCNDIK